MGSPSKNWWWSRDLIPNIFLVDNFLPEDIFRNLSEEVKNSEEYSCGFFREVTDNLMLKTQTLVLDRLKEMGHDIKPRIGHTHFRPAGDSTTNTRLHCDNGGYVFFIHSDWDSSWEGQLLVDDQCLFPEPNRFVWINPQVYHRVVPVGLNAEHCRVSNIAFLDTRLDHLINKKK